MAKAAPAITSFNGGEWSPLMYGRTDLKYYPTACRKMRNFIPTPQGPSRFRPGTVHVNSTKNGADRAWLYRFEFNVEQAYILEFGHNYIRFFSNHGVVESSPGVPLEVASPYTAAQLTASDGRFNLRMVQSGDVVYICHPSHYPHKLSRTGAAAFTLAVADFKAGPFKDVNPDETVTVYSSAAIGTVTLTASSAIFTPDRVGQQIFLENRNISDIKQWEVGKAVTAGALRRSDGKTYKALNSATTGNTKPTHNYGALFDGDVGVQWEYQDAGYGWAKITAASGTTATAEVLSQLPDNVITSGKATTRWAFSAWSSTDGYPTEVTFFRNRLCFFRGTEKWLSVSGDYENFERKDAGTVTADMSMYLELSSDRSNRIEWAVPFDTALLVGTAGDEHAVAENTSNEAFGPENRRARKQSDYGSKHVAPVRVGEGVLYVQKSGRKVRDCVMAESVNERWVSNDTTVMADHITRSGILQMAYQQEPDSVIWAVAGDGGLIGFTLNRAQDVKAWHLHTLGGNGEVESVAATPSPDGFSDELWMIVKRTINGTTVRHVEYMTRHHEEYDAPEDAFYLDSGLTYVGPVVDTLTGLGHLEGETVKVVVNGATHPDCAVASGAIELTELPSGDTMTVHVGLGYLGVLSPMPIDAGAADGTSQGKTSRISKCGIRFYNTGAAKYGRDEQSQLDQIELRLADDVMDSPPSLFSGDMVVSWPDGYQGHGNITIIQDQPQPCNVVALYPHIVVNDAAGARTR